jgi:hypothetical protein
VSYDNENEEETVVEEEEELGMEYKEPNNKEVRQEVEQQETMGMPKVDETCALPHRKCGECTVLPLCLNSDCWSQDTWDKKIRWQ